MDGTELHTDRPSASGDLHYRENHIAFGRVCFLLYAIGNAAEYVVYVRLRVRRKSNLHFWHEAGLRFVRLSGDVGTTECIGRRLAWGFVATQHLPAFFKYFVIVVAYIGILEDQDVIGVHVEAGQGEVRRAGEDLYGASAPQHDKDLVVGVSIKRPAHDVRWILLAQLEQIGELIFRRSTDVLFRVVQNDT